MGYEEQMIEGRNAVLEAFRSGKTSCLCRRGCRTDRCSPFCGRPKSMTLS